jgi:deoxyinosine 3'endonuclease (endonuclease V)
VRKKIMHFPHIDERIEDGTVQVDELCGVDIAFKESGTYPRCALILITKVFERYMEDGVLPDKESFFK